MPCYRQVRLQDIHLTDRTYTLNPFSQEPDESLLQSIRSVGILHPPLLLEKQDASFTILSGRRRIAAYLQICNTQEQKKEEGHDHITALTLTLSRNGETPKNQHHLLTTLLQHQLLGGSLTVIEQAVFFQKAMLLALEEQDVLALLPLLGLKAKPHIPKELLALLDLAPTVQLGLHKGIIAQRSGKKLSRFSPEDQELLAQVIDEYQLGGSKQQKVIDRFVQLTQREKLPIQVLLTRWRKGEKDKQLNGPQRTNSLLRWLDRECQPRLTQAEDEFRRFCCQLQLPAGVRLDHSLSFEEEQITLSLDFRGKEELIRIWPQLEALLRQE
ncbi:MAG: ParB N-terminal domain-containing protein [Candidatus Electrothrix sp. GW3-4]|uniref:ParB N-terminal domain-containing protein n=1 Tax=Candidatus Electrothrix sp. GW3-4 TaxID=3126740 RepID=UPI0030D1DEF8